MIYRDFLVNIHKQVPLQTEVRLSWKSGLELICQYEGQYETDNRKDLTDPTYTEYRACLFCITEIIRFVDEGIENVSAGCLIEINPTNVPDYAYSKDDKVIWNSNS
ncbi:hypothetical protein [Bacillus infantis]|jgi:hypothetical protein|uniref:hypothetical protein n=1 Tax=Bacillus infantis TaxID=324767 RepID=UPI002155AF29|nr:hypothetical protein [Bacillus infantis]MCR6610575.1 hypothetical protein [Bacillus infantis]